MNTPKRLQSERPRDGGYATAFVIVLTLALMAVIGLAVDGGSAAAAHARAQTAAAEAARAGADQIDLEHFRSTGITRLDPAAASTAAADWLTTVEQTGTVTATTGAVTVTVTGAQGTQVLGIVGIDAIEVTATATAEPRNPQDTALQSLTEIVDPGGT